MIRMATACVATLLFGGAAAARDDLAVLKPAQAIAMKNAARGGLRARFEMTVVAYGHRPGALYLNSAADYKAPDNLTFQLPPGAERALLRKLGGRLETVVGRRVVVEGILDNVPIAETDYGRPIRLVRVQHMVRLRQVGQLIAVE